MSNFCSNLQYILCKGVKILACSVSVLNKILVGRKFSKFVLVRPSPTCGAYGGGKRDAQGVGRET
jgi:hypothetical protein